MGRDYLEKSKAQVEQFLAGERELERMCLTPSIAIILQEEYPIVLKVNERVNKHLGLYMFKVEKKEESS